MNKLPILDETKYDYWKAHMVDFIKSMDNKAWKSMVKGRDQPMSRDKDGKIIEELKPEEDWDDEGDKLAQGNSKALNALFNGMDRNNSRLINNLLPKMLGRS